MAIITSTINHLDGDTVLEAFFAYDDATTGQRPVVMVNHTWVGRDAFVEGKAKQLAELGYLGFAVDMYGKGLLGKSPEENAALMQPFINDRALVQKRMQAALTTVKQLPWADNGKIAAIGFCFGGLCVLDLARTGADLQGVVSFHGLLGAPKNLNDIGIKAKILACHGHDDPMVPVEQVVAFENEMTAAGADWQFLTFGNTMHAFTNPNANTPSQGMDYRPKADRRSWLAMKNFLAEVLA